MSVETAKSRLNRQPTDPAEGWIEPSRVQTSYDDLQDGWQDDIAATILATHKDTGWRDIETLLDPFWGPIAAMYWLPTLTLRRIEGRVIMQGRLKVVTGGTPIGGYTLICKPPAGFRAGAYVNVGGTTLHESDAHMYAGGIGSFTDAANIEVRFASENPVMFTEAHMLIFETSWTTPDAWPTTLPGVPTGLARPDLNKPNDTQE